MLGMEGSWRYLVIALFAVLAGAGVGVALGGANSDPYDTVVKTVTGERHTVTETETVTKTRSETVTADTAPEAPVDSGATTDDDADGDGCSDSYLGACLNPSDGLNQVACTTVDTNFQSVADDPYGLDPDGDGVACES